MLEYINFKMMHTTCGLTQDPKITTNKKEHFISPETMHTDEFVQLHNTERELEEFHEPEEALLYISHSLRTMNLYLI